MSINKASNRRIVVCGLLGLFVVSCQSEDEAKGISHAAGPRRGSQLPSEVVDALVSSPDSSPSDSLSEPVDKPVTIVPKIDSSVGDLPSDPVDKGVDVLLLDVVPAQPDLMSKKDAELLGPGKSCSANNQCQQGHCSTLTGRCCQTACLDTGCGLGCGPDGLCIACQFCTCTSGQCHC
jgi:hypothetical protein